MREKTVQASVGFDTTTEKSSTNHTDADAAGAAADDDHDKCIYRAQTKLNTNIVKNIQNYTHTHTHTHTHLNT